MNSYSKHSDSELCSRLQMGDEIAYAEIFDRYKVLLYIFAYKKMDDREEAKDLVHELFLMIWEKHEEITIESELSAFLFSVLKNKIFNLYKRKKVSERYIDTFLKYLDFNSNTTDHLVRHNDLSALIENEIAALPPKMRQVFELSRKTNLTRKKIAAELNITENTVKSHMHNALSILKTKLGALVFILLFLHR